MSRGHLVYRLALHAYSASYRGERRLPDLREVAALVAGGLRRRSAIRLAGGAGSWRSGALLAAYVLATVNAAVALLGVIQEQRLGWSIDFGVPGFGPRLDVFGLVAAAAVLAAAATWSIRRSSAAG